MSGNVQQYIVNGCCVMTITSLLHYLYFIRVRTFFILSKTASAFIFPVSRVTSPTPFLARVKTPPPPFNPYTQQCCCYGQIAVRVHTGQT